MLYRTTKIQKYIHEWYIKQLKGINKIAKKISPITRGNKILTLNKQKDNKNIRIVL